MVRSLLLRNAPGGDDANACFANSIIQVLRRLEIFKESLFLNSPIQIELKRIFNAEGSSYTISASYLRKLVGPMFSNRQQQDCMEFLTAVLNKIPDLLGIFRFSVKRTFEFVGSSFSPACKFCHANEDPVTTPESVLHVPMYNASELQLQDLINTYFNFEASTKRCSKCYNRTEQAYHVHPQFCNPGSVLIVQLNRFTGQKKNENLVRGIFSVRINNISFRLVAIINHLGDSPKEGHYQTFLEENGKWFLCDDYRMPTEKSIE